MSPGHGHARPIRYGRVGANLPRIIVGIAGMVIAFYPFYWYGTLSPKSSCNSITVIQGRHYLAANVPSWFDCNSWPIGFLLFGGVGLVLFLSGVIPLALSRNRRPKIPLEPMPPQTQ